MKKIKLFQRFLVLILLTGTMAGCSLIEVDNPNITDDKFLGTSQSASIWLNGMKKQLSSTLNQTVVFSEMVSDNYANNSSLSNQVFDTPNLLATDLDIDQLQRQISRLREMAIYGIEKVVPAAKEESDEILAEIYFLGAYAYMLTAEMHAYFPMVASGEVHPAADHFKMALEYLYQAKTLDSDPNRLAAYTLALARVYYQLGDAEAAVREANSAISAAPLLLHAALFDGLSGASNLMQSYTFSSSTNTLAPLPRLDFLDPKYFHVGNIASDQKSIAILKIEEAYLILAEAALGKHQLAEAKTQLKNLLQDVIPQRPIATMVDAKHSIRKGTRSDYPLDGQALVQADAQAEPMSGLVLPRKEQLISVHQVSGTSVTTQQIDHATTRDELLYLLSLVRQEVFMSEGRRMTDLGIRFPISNIEKLNNPHVKAEHLNPVIPSFIPAGRGLDDFEYDKEARLVVIKHDMNRVLVDNKTFPTVLPLIKD